MAPTKPSKRTSIRSKASRVTTAATSTPTTTTPASTATLNQPKKRQKLASKHTTFLKKIEKKSSKTPPTSSRSRRRKRKASDTLLAGLESLADALPTDSISDSVNFVSGSSKILTAGNGAGIGRKSLKSRPGAMKRKETIVKSECERFGKNLAIMQTEISGQGNVKVSNGVEGGTQLKNTGAWAALRGFIEGTMEKKEEFVEMEKEKQQAMEIEI